MIDDLTVEIRRRAYAFWERENRPEGKHLEHWLCAKAEIEAEQLSVADQPASEQSDTAEPAQGSSRANRRSS